MKKYVFFLALIILSNQLFAQFFKNNGNVAEYQGFFDFYYDSKADKIYLVVDKLDQEFIYVSGLSQGIGSNDIGIDRGQLGGGKVVKFIKMGNKLLLLEPNQQFRAVTENPEEKKSVEEAFAKSVLYGFKIEKQQGGKYLIDLTDFIIRDAHAVVQKLKSGKQGNYQLDRKRSALNLNRTRAFPKNTEFDALLTFTGNPKGSHIRSVTPDPAAVSVYQHHSFVRLPDAGYKPRVFDPRCGMYPLSFYDYATPVDQNIKKQYVFRHRLAKKNPQAALSEPVEPIVYYLDPGVPEPVRSALMEGAAWWNQAFEAAGYKNAFQVKILPKGADPLDLRYNVIQWVHRSTRGWSYGMTISDPRTGEILKGHVSLGSLRIRQDFMIAQALQPAYTGNSDKDDFALQMALARIRQLAAHEVGHTLGFAHNFAASTVNRASVMDYPHPWIKVKDGKIDFSDAYATGIGEWDKVTVAYAYGDYRVHEEKALRELLDKAFSNGMRYVSDADARPAGSAHAYAHLWDNGNDIVKELGNVLAVRKVAMAAFSEANIRKGEPFSKLEDVFVPLYFYHRYQTEAVSKMIGGVDYAYNVRGGSGNRNQPLPEHIQQGALKMLMKTIDAEQLAISKRLLQLFPPRAMGFPRTRESFKSNNGPVFDPFGAALTASDFTFDFLLHPQRINRVAMQHMLDPGQLGIDVVLKSVYDQTMAKHFSDGYLQGIRDVVAENMLEHLFALVANEQVYPMAKTVLVNRLESWRKNLANSKYSSDRFFAKKIEQFLKSPDKFKVKPVPKIPDGSPIGTFK